MTASDVWSAVVGQSEAVQRLRAAVSSPVHSYLFVGPAGLGKRDAAAVFAGELLAATDPESADRHRRLARRLEHPDVTVVTPSGNLFRVVESEELVERASLAPVEGSRKIVIAERFHDSNAEAMPPLLKMVEDPPPSTVFVFLADEIKPDHVTIASRSVVVDFGLVGAETIEATLVGEGVDHAVAAAAARSAGGRIERARRLAHDPQVETRRAAWRSIPERLDGRGCSVALLVDEVRGLIDDAMEPLRELHTVEMAEMERREEQLGRKGSGRKDLEAHHKRTERRFRTEEIRFGLATLAERYRETITSGGVPTADLDAIHRLAEVAEAINRNANEALMLQALLLRLPPLGATTDAGRG